ncbi:MAG: metal-dependent transcriptional regulator [Saprospiraceae bacterium]|jgi:DtxR family Mn-dependent transcriptional regulator
MLSHTEENYLRTVFDLTERNRGSAGTNDIAAVLHTSAASVTDMIRRMASKDLLVYEKYKGVKLSQTGMKHANRIIRRERLWKVFLSEKLGLSWDKLERIADQLKHVKSEEMIEALDDYLRNPKFDPHGEAIPNSAGRFTLRNQSSLVSLSKYDRAVVVGVRNHSPDFLRYLSSSGMTIGSQIEVTRRFDFDYSMEIQVGGKTKIVLPAKHSTEIYVRKI